MNTNICDINHGHGFTSFTWDVYVGKFNLSTPHLLRQHAQMATLPFSMTNSSAKGRERHLHGTLSISEETKAIRWKASVKAD